MSIQPVADKFHESARDRQKVRGKRSVLNAVSDRLPHRLF
jgi:hypothetical protein